MQISLINTIITYKPLKIMLVCSHPNCSKKLIKSWLMQGTYYLKKKENSPLHGRCDSFVVETDVHYPTDINLLFDAMRKGITLTAELCDRHGVSEWRQHAYNVRHVKRLMRTAQNKKRSKAKSQPRA